MSHTLTRYISYIQNVLTIGVYKSYTDEVYIIQMQCMNHTIIIVCHNVPLSLAECSSWIVVFPIKENLVPSLSFGVFFD